MYCYYSRLCVCVCVCPSPHSYTTASDPAVTLGNGRGCSSCAVLGGFKIGARVSLLWQHTRLMRNVSEDHFTHYNAGFYCQSAECTLCPKKVAKFLFLITPSKINQYE